MYKIVIADDEQLVQIALKRTLEELYANRAEVSAAANGREAVQAALQSRADVAILDIEMPGMNGLEAARRIIKTLPDCKIVMLTAYGEFSYAREALTLGSADYLLKPCSDAELMTALDKLFNQIDKRREAEAERKDFLRRIEILSQRLEEQLAIESAGGAFKVEDSGQLGRVKRDIEQFVAEHFQEELFLPEMAKSMNYSIAHFSRLFKQIFNRNFIVYLTEMRIRAAKEFLRDTDMTVREIGRSVGYNEPNYFTKVFRKSVGQSPSEYREMKRAAVN